MRVGEGGSICAAALVVLFLATSVLGSTFFADDWADSDEAGTPAIPEPEALSLEPAPEPDGSLLTPLQVLLSGPSKLLIPDGWFPAGMKPALPGALAEFGLSDTTGIFMADPRTHSTFLLARGLSGQKEGGGDATGGGDGVPEPQTIFLALISLLILRSLRFRR